MGPLEDEENRDESNSRKNNLNGDLSNVATQQIYSQFSLGGVLEGDGDDDFLYITNTMPVEDYLLEDPFETQLVNLDGETQVVDLAGETQVVDLAGETQVLDCMKDMPIEFLNEFNAEDAAVSDYGTNKTKALCETQELSQDDSVKIDGNDSVGQENPVDDYIPKRGDNVFGAPSDTFGNEELHSGSVCRGFTSIRTASIRASGLAARARGANVNSCSTSSEKSSLEQQTCEQDGSSRVGYLLKPGSKNAEEGLRNEYNEDSDELSNANKCKFGSTAVRKLFTEDEVAEVGQSEADINHTDDNLDMPELFASKNCVTGLSYANSQEPGELSQANALEVVDRFLDLNAMEYDEGFVPRVHIAERPKVVSGAKGSRDLAKSYIHKSTEGNCGVYDWDDTREDDGGGDFFLKKKELFFDKGGPKRRSLSEPRCPDLRSIEAVGDHGDEKEQTHPEKKSGNSISSESGLMLHKLKAKEKKNYCGEERFHKNLTAESDEQLNMATRHKLADNGTSKDISDMKNTGPDTQMAAEAMETLCFEVHLADSNGSGPNKGARSTAKATIKKQSSNRTAHSEQCFTPKVPYPASVGVVTRQARQIKRTTINASNEPSLSSKKSKNTRKRHVTLHGEEEQRRLADVNVFACHGTKSTGQRSEKKRQLEERLDFSAPVAHRTRKCTESNRSKPAANSFDAREEVNDLISARVLRKRRTAAKDENAEMGSVDKGRKVGSSGFKQSNNAAQCDSDYVNVKSSLKDMVDANTSKQCDEKSDAQTWISAESAETDGRLEASPKEKCGTSISNCSTPATCATPIKNISPICMGDEYHRQSCRKSLSRLSLIKEINNLVTSTPGPYGRVKDSRKRKDITNIRVLFSQHLDLDVIKQQKKILARLGAAVASSMSDATHFVADEFVRTRNMLEAIAFGKPVVTHLWIESCGQASCLIDEKNYILRDARKEKEFGFCLPVSLSRACQHPLLQGQRVLVTPNTKPGKDILANLVKAVHGLAVERLGRSALKDEKLPEDLLILSCEEDYDICVPFLEKGCAVYSSELLLNGIVKQKLEYERHCLFADHVKRTRSTIWVKKKDRYLPVEKRN